MLALIIHAVFAISFALLGYHEHQTRQLGRWWRAYVITSYILAFLHGLFFLYYLVR